MQFGFPEFLSSPVRGEKANSDEGLHQLQRPVIGAGGAAWRGSTGTERRQGYLSQVCYFKVRKLRPSSRASWKCAVYRQWEGGLSLDTAGQVSSPEFLCAG